MSIGAPVRAETPHHLPARANYRGVPRTQTTRLPRARAFTSSERPEPLTVVRAPHGFGKSTLAAQWLRSFQGQDVDVVWVGPDAHPVTGVWGALAERLREVAHEPAVPVGPVPEPYDDVVRLLRERTRPAVVVVDRLEHVAAKEPGVERALLELVQSAEQLHLVVCAREVGMLEVVGAASVDTLVLRPADLALSVEDVMSLAAQQELPLRREQAARLVEDTGGWPALVRVVLTGSAVAHRPEDEEVVVDLDAGRWFLRAAWDEFATPGLSDLVLRTSLLAEFTVEQALELCPGVDVVVCLAALHGAGLLRARQEDGRTVHVHLPAVRRECVQRLRGEQPELFEELSRSAARTLLAQGRAGAAVVHLVRARLWDDLVDCVEQGWETLLGYGEDELGRLLGRLPAEVVERSPWLVVLRDHVVGAADRALPTADGASGEGDATLAPLLGRVFGAGARHGAGAKLLAVGARYAALRGDVRARLPEVLAEWATTRLVAADTVAAHAAFVEAHALAGEVGDTRTLVRSAVGAALVDVVHGEIAAANRRLDDLDATSYADAGLEDRATAAFVTATRALVALGRLDLGSRDLAAVVDARECVDEARALYAVVRTQALVLAPGGPVGGDGEGRRRQAPVADDDLLGALLVTARVELLLAQGRVFQARSLLARSGGADGVLMLSRARTVYHGGDFTRAVSLARQGLEVQPTVPRLRLGMLLVLALAEDARGNAAEAGRAAREALVVADASGLRQYFAHVPREALRALSGEAPGLAQVVAELDGQGLPDVFPTPRVVAELSERELEVLETLAVSDSLGAVARRLFLTTNTVKTHLRSIYRKLGTHSAAETVRRAVECGLIEPPTA